MESPRPGLDVAAKVVLTTGSLVLPVALLNWNSKPAFTRVALLLVTVGVAARLWGHVASHYVPEPYLDEVFHVPQAQRYCERRFMEWDDKITTPPGLYLLSLIIPKSVISGSFTEAFSCDTASLRGVNAICLAVLAWLFLQSRQQLEARHQNAAGAPSLYAVHSALNIALCPVIFFFSGLYYTDVASAVAVFASLLNSLKRMGRDENSLSSDMTTVALGISALLMRQTNIFWVVVFAGGLEAVHAVETLRPSPMEGPRPSTTLGKIKFIASKYSCGEVHDPPADVAWPDDMLFTAVSLVIAAICNPLRVLRKVWPHVAVLSAFVGFVAWNDGVVLGDKSNHVATIHLAQMLYIWPLFVFLSLPLLLPHVVQIYTATCSILSTRNEKATNHESVKSADPLWKQAILGIYLLITTLISALIVRFNTIIHPFTLADNRHYMFYVFRYTIRRGALTRLALVVPYTLCRWVIWGTLTGSFAWPLETIVARDPQAAEGTQLLLNNHPFAIESTPPTAVTGPKAKRGTKRPAVTRAPPQNSWMKTWSTEPASTSTCLVFLLATTLSLVTAPLVEPRYFIVPWLVWRLLIPEWRPRSGGSLPPKLADMCTRHDVRLLLETGWFIAINAGTMYMFLFKPYRWRAEDGTLLDEGRWQRFMW